MSERRERLAIALEDIEQIEQDFRGPLLKGRLDLTTIIRVMGESVAGDTPIVAFSCDLLTAAVVCDLLRARARKEGKVPPRMYWNKTGVSWYRVTLDVVFTVVVNGRARLNPEAFPNEVLPGAPLPVKPFNVR